MSSTILAERAKTEGLWNYIPKQLLIYDQNLFNLLKAQNDQTWIYKITDMLAHEWPGVVVIFLVLFYVYQILRKENFDFKFLYFIAFISILVLSNYISDELKSVFLRLKPHLSQDVPGLKQPMSFPSNHSFNTATILGCGVYIGQHLSRLSRIKTIGVLTLVWTFTGWSRVFLGEHFPLDVIGGLFFGFIYGFYASWTIAKGLSLLGK